MIWKDALPLFFLPWFSSPVLTHEFSPEPDHQRKGRDDHVTVYDKALKALEQGPAVAGGATAGYYVID